MATPRKVVAILLFAIVCFAILGDIEGPGSRSNGSGSRKSRGSRSQSPPGSAAVTSRLRRGVSALTGLLRSGTRKDGAGPSRTRSGRSGSGSGSYSRSYSRSRSRSQSMSPEPTIPAGIECAPVHWTVTDDYGKFIVNMFAGKYQRAKSAEELTAAEYGKIKYSLNVKATADHCFSLDVARGNSQCSQALEELQSIPENFRGPCGKAFASFCHMWPLPQSSTCSFFIKKTRGNNPPLDGCVIKIRDCVQPLVSRDDYQKHLDDVADSYIVSPDH